MSGTGVAQMTLDGTERDEYVAFADETGLEYHRIRGDDPDLTICGVDFSDRSTRTFSDPGEALEQCDECDENPSITMSNEEIVEWLADPERADFEPTGRPHGQLNKAQLVAIRNYILDLEKERRISVETNGTDTASGDDDEGDSDRTGTETAAESGTEEATT